MKRHVGAQAQTRRLIAGAGFAPGARILDMGAGDGTTVRLLRALGFEAEGVDLEPRGDGVREGDFLHMDCADGSFDGIVSECAFYVSGDQQGAFCEAARLLKKGGVLAVADVFCADAEQMARRAGFALVYTEDLTAQWREYYLEAIWRGETAPCGGGKCVYQVLIGRKE